MDRFIIEGPTRLDGTVRISGAKNAVLPLMAAALLTRGESVIANVPDLRDVRFFMEVLTGLGARCDLTGDVLRIDTSQLTGNEAPYDLVRKMRASIYVLGPLLASQGRARVSLPGGCAWGPRPVNLHLEGMRQLGAEITLEAGYIQASAPSGSPGDKPGGLTGGSFRFEPASVGATANVLMAAVLAHGTTELANCAREPEVAELARALAGAGARIEGIGESQMTIEGVESLRPLDHRVIADRIEAGTFLAAAAITRGRICLENCQPDHMQAVLAVMQALGCEIETGADSVTIDGSGRTAAVEVVTRPFPGFPTDMQAQVMAACSLADGTSFITETIYQDRFTHVAELRRLGADIRLDGATAIVFGQKRLQGAPVMATDLRASAALILGGMAAEGTTTINRVYHIDRGYERIESKLAGLGASIRRESG
ncbi:MAG: UDP-N-acetylglucosamine 1-carboxyvinyltransferase [bacterium]